MEKAILLAVAASFCTATASVCQRLGARRANHGEMRGFDALLHQETGLSIRATEDPLTCVARGAGTVLDQLDILKRVAIPA